MMHAFATFEIVFAAVIWSLVAWAWWQRRQSGALLVEFEPNQGPSVRPALLTVLLTFTIVGLAVSLISADVGIETIASSVFTSAIAAGIAAQTFLAPQIREHGLLVRGRLVRWMEIDRYMWERNKPHELTLQVHTTLPLRAMRSITMPPIYRDKVEAVLAQHVPTGVPG